MGNDNDDDADNQDDVGQEYDEQDDDNQDDDDQEHDGQENEEQDDVNEQTNSDNDDDDLVHPKLSTHDEEDKEEEDSDPRVHTPSNYESTDDEESIDSIFNRNTESTSLIDVPVTTIAKPPLLSIITLPPPPPSHHISATNTTVSSIPNIIDAYLANKMHEAVKIAVQLQSKRLKDEAQAENADFINKLNDNIKKIIKDQVKEQNLYKALVDAYESDKLILDTYGETVSFKRRRDEEDKDEEPSAGSNWGSKRRRAGKEPESTGAPKEKTSKTTGKSTEGSKSHHKSTDESAQAEEPMQTAKDLEESTHQEFEIGVTEDHPNEETSQLPDCFQKPAKPPTPDRDWNKTLPDAHGPVQPWLSSLA
ncbi:hypothetical protein Tco_0607713 [Tanacetum coccineum]